MTKRSPILGYNHNIKHRGLVFHVQTEDSGVDKAHIFTHLFHGGVILQSRKLDYDGAASEEAIKSLMQAQHKASLKALLGGDLDSKIDAYLPETPGLLPSAAAFEAARAGADADVEELARSAAATIADIDPISEAADAIAEAAEALAAAADAVALEPEPPIVVMVADAPSEPIPLDIADPEPTLPLDLPDLMEMDAEIPSGQSNDDDLEAELEIVPQLAEPDPDAPQEIEMIADEPELGSHPIPLMGDATQRVSARPPPIPEQSDPAIIHDAIPHEITRQRSAGSYSQVRGKRLTPGVTPSVERIPTDKLPIVKAPSDPRIEPPINTEERATRSSQRIPVRPENASGAISGRSGSVSGSISPRTSSGSVRVPPRPASASGSVPTRPSSAAQSAPTRSASASGSVPVPAPSAPSTPVPVPPKTPSQAAVGKRAREQSRPNIAPPPTPAAAKPPPRKSPTNPPSQRGVVVSRPAVIIGAPPKQIGLESSGERKRAEARRTNPRLAREDRSRSSLFGKDLISEKSLDEVILAYLSEDGSEE